MSRALASIVLVQQLIVTAHVNDNWPDFFFLVDAFVPAYGSPSLQRLSRVSPPFEGEGGGSLTDSDRAVLVTLVADIFDLLKARHG